MRARMLKKRSFLASRKSMIFRKSQTATEYLIITAVVIIIALIVVGVLGGIPGLGSGVSDQQKTLELQVEKVASSSIAVTETGTILTLSNNHGSSMRIEQVWVDGLPCSTTDIRFPHQLGVGRDVQITCGNVDSSVFTDTVPDVNIIWTEISTSASYTTYERQENMKSHECLWSDDLSGCLEFYVDDGCGDGTVLHTLTGLCWQKDLGASGTLNWTDAVTYCDDLELGGHDDWYLPSLNEFSFIRDLATGGAPYIVGSDGSGSSTLFDNYPGSSQLYWTSSTLEEYCGWSGCNPGAWSVNLNYGYDYFGNQYVDNYRAVCSRRN